MPSAVRESFRATVNQMWNAACGMRSVPGRSSRRFDLPLTFRIPHFQFRIPHSACRIGTRLALLVFLTAPIPAGAQGGGTRPEPLRKTDLIRLLTGNTMTPAQIASLVQRHCLSFTPTARDRQNLVSLGADSAILRRIDACVRAPRARAAVPRPAPPPAAAPVEPPAPPATFVPAPPPPPPPPPAPEPPRPAPERTGFASGMGQRGRVGETAPLPVVFEVRDASGAALAGFPVTLTIMNGRLLGAPRATDSLGQVRAQVVFGDRAGAPTVITGTAGAIVRQTMLYAMPGAPARLVVLLDGNALVGQVVFQSGRRATLRIFCRDAVGNSVPLAALSGASGDERLLRVTGVISDSLGGSVTVTAARAGSTTLVIRGTGLLAEFTALVRR